MRLGLSSYAYSWACALRKTLDGGESLTALELAQRTEKAGLDLIQYGDNLPLHQLTDDELEELIAYCRSNKLRVDMGTVGIEPENILRYAVLGQRFGSGMIRTLLPAERNTQKLVKQLKELEPVLRKYDIALAIENYELLSCREYCEILSQLPEDCFGLCLDTANSLGKGESAEQFLELMAQRTICLHIKDVDARRLDTRMGFVIEGARAGKGIINIPALLKRCNLTCPDCCVILEQWPPFAESPEKTLQMEEKWVNEGVAYLKACLADLK